VDPKAFYCTTGPGCYAPTEAAQGPRYQYGGALAALLIKTAQGLLADPSWHLASATCSYLAPTPMAEIHASATRVTRRGRSELVESVLHVNGQATAACTSWWLAPQREDVPALETEFTAPTVPKAIPHPRPPFGYLRASERRFAKGDFLEPGPAFVWTRTDLPLVEGEPSDPLHHLVIGSDISCAVSFPLQLERFNLANVDLTVRLHRQPINSWTGIDATTEVGSHGIGLTHAVLWDSRGPVGSAGQTLRVKAMQTQK
jgi:hypothetical protein